MALSLLSQCRFMSLNEAAVASSSESDDNFECRVEVRNLAPKDYQIHIYGSCEFFYSDGSTSRDDQLNNHYYGDTIRWKSKDKTSCVEKIVLAIIAKSPLFADEGKYALTEKAKPDECILEAGWDFGKRRSIGKDSSSLQDLLVLTVRT